MVKLNEGYKAALLVFAGFLFFIYGLGSFDLVAPDEPRFALVAREMLETGNFLFPHRNERAYPDKPPLFFWSIAAFSKVTGEVNAWSSRLPSAAAALVSLFLIASWGTNGRWKSMAGIAILVILASGMRFIQQAHNAQIDMLLCVLVLSSTLLGYRRLQGENVSQMGLGLLLGLAILAKGPVGYIMPAGTWAVYCLWSGKSSWKHYPLRSLLWGLLPPALWIGGLTLQVWQQNAWDYWNNLLFKQTVVRYTNAWHHHKPFYYYSYTMVTDFSPWALLLPAAFPWKRSQRKAMESKTRFAWSAILFIVIFFSFSSGKRDLYILPAYPFCAFILANYLLAITRPHPAIRAILGLGGVVFVASGVGLAAVALGLVNLEVLKSLENPLPKTAITALGTLISIGGVVGIASAIRWKANKALLGFGLSLFSLGLLYYQVVCPYIDPQRSARDFTQKFTAIREADPANPEIGMVDFRSAFRLYGRYRIIELSTFAPTESDPKLIGLPNPMEFWAQYPTGYIIIRSHDLDEFKEKSAAFPPYKILLEKSISQDRHLLIAQSEVQLPVGGKE